MALTYKERASVKQGAALLDTILPGWYKQITLEKLDMASGSLCMMGQLFGHATEADLARVMYPEEMANRPYGYNGYSNGIHNVVPRAMKKAGFADTTYDQAYTNLKHVCSGHDNKCMWVEEIAERMAHDEGIE